MEQEASKELRERIIASMVKNGMRVSLVAKELGYFWSTIDYHIKEIKKSTGKDPRNFYDLAELAESLGLGPVWKAKTEVEE